MIELQQKVFEAIEEEIDLFEFEFWLSCQKNIDDYLDHTLINDLLTFDYHQKSALLMFEFQFLNQFDKRDFMGFSMPITLNKIVCQPENLSKYMERLEIYIFESDLLKPLFEYFDNTWISFEYTEAEIDDIIRKTKQILKTT